MTIPARESIHEWPAGVIARDDEQEFEQQRRSLRYDRVGNEPARLLVDLLELTAENPPERR